MLDFVRGRSATGSNRGLFRPYYAGFGAGGGQPPGRTAQSPASSTFRISVVSPPFGLGVSLCRVTPNDTGVHFIFGECRRLVTF